MHRYFVASLISGLLITPRIELAYAKGNPSDLGPYQTESREYNLGDSAFVPTQNPFEGDIEFKAIVHYPKEISKESFPLIIFQHGNHAQCYTLGVDNSNGNTFEGVSREWPCTEGRIPIPNHEGYNYLAEHMASHGYIVASVSASGVLAGRPGGPEDRLNREFSVWAELLAEHVDYWNRLNREPVEPFGSLFVGRVDTQQIGLMGHSRGGQAILQYFRDFVENVEPPRVPHSVKAVMTVASTNDVDVSIDQTLGFPRLFLTPGFERLAVNHVPQANVLAYCDGDVMNHPSIRYLDDSIQRVPNDTSPKHGLVFAGANHNFFNTIWTPDIFPAGATDDWDRFTPNIGATFARGLPDISADDVNLLVPCFSQATESIRLSASQQRESLLVYLSAFFRVYLGNEVGLMTLLTGHDKPNDLERADDIHVSYIPPNDPQYQLRVNKLEESSNLEFNTLGGAVETQGLVDYELCGTMIRDSDMPPCVPPKFLIREENNFRPGFFIFNDGRQPHSIFQSRLLQLERNDGLVQLRLAWETKGSAYINHIPHNFENLEKYSAIRFRAAVNFADERNVEAIVQRFALTARQVKGKDIDFSVGLVDSQGVEESVVVSNHSDALYFPAGLHSDGLASKPQLLLNDVVIPLDQFKAVDLASIRSIKFVFDQTDSGSVLISDLSFTGNDLCAPFARLQEQVQHCSSRP